MRNPPSESVVRWVVLGTIAVTLFHFTDNAVNVDTYPKAGWQPDWFEYLVVVGWLLYTAVGVAGYRLYERGRFRAAHACLLIYGYLIASSLGHFLYGSPDELTTRGLISVFVDVAAGLTVMAVALWSILARRARAPRAEARLARPGH
jgi:CHASE2 domain-containing sensor protein